MECNALAPFMAPVTAALRHQNGVQKIKNSNVISICYINNGDS